MTLPFTLEDHLPSTGDVGAIFADEIATLGGALVDLVEHDEQLFGRALLPDRDDVTPGDSIFGGVAIRVWGPWVSVHAYTHRQVCSNGAMGVAPGEVFRVERVPGSTPIELVTPVHDAIRAAVRQCVDSPAFLQAIVRMRVATQSDVHGAMYLLPQLLQAMSLLAPPGWHDRTLHEVIRRYVDGGDVSLFGLLNAVTSTARDEADPARRWALQEVGGQLLAATTVPPRTRVGRMPHERVRASHEIRELVGTAAND